MATPLSPRGTVKQVDILSGNEREMPARDFRPGALVKAQMGPSDANLDPITGQPKSVVLSPRSSYHRKSSNTSEPSAEWNNYNLLSGANSEAHHSTGFAKREVAAAPSGPVDGPIAGRPIIKSPTAAQRQIISSAGALTKEATRPVNPITGAPVTKEPTRSTSQGAFTLEAKENGRGVNPITGEKVPTSPTNTHTMGQMQKEWRENGYSVNPITGEKVDPQPRRVRSTKKVDKDDGHL